MIMKCFKLGGSPAVLGSALIAAVAVAAVVSLPAQAEPAAPRTEADFLAESELGRVRFSNLKDQRSKSARRVQRINEEGIIGLEEYRTLTFARSNEEAMLEVLATIGSPEIPASFRRRLEDRRLGALVLNRILDHEAMKRGFSPLVSESRVSYIVRSFLVQFGMDAGKLKKRTVTYDKVSLTGNPIPNPCGVSSGEALDQSIEDVSEERMFSWLRGWVAENAAKYPDQPNIPINFETDWTNGGSLGLAVDHGFAQRDHGWPVNPKTEVLRTGGRCQVYAEGEEASVKMTIALGGFPKTVDEFRGVVRSVLQATYIPYMRRAVWQQIVAETDPLHGWKTGLSVTGEQLDRMAKSGHREEMLKTIRQEMSQVAPDKKLTDEELDRLLPSLRQLVEARMQGRIFRKAAYKLFKLNPLEFTREPKERVCMTCMRQPTAKLGSPRAMADALFPEILYPGMSLEDIRPAVNSTLAHDEAFDRVMAISVSDIETVFNIPNRH